MNKALRYKFDTAEIVASIVGTVVMILSARLTFNEFYLKTDFSRTVFTIAIVLFISSIFGTISGGLVGFLGYVGARLTCGLPVVYGDAIALALIGMVMGQFASKFGIRDNKFNLKNVFVWILTNIVVLIAICIFEKPFADFIIYEKDLPRAILEGMDLFYVLALPVGVALSVLLYIIGKISSYVKR